MSDKKSITLRIVDGAPQIEFNPNDVDRWGTIELAEAIQSVYHTCVVGGVGNGVRVELEYRDGEAYWSGTVLD